MTNFPFPSIGNTESTVSNFLMEKTPQPCGTHGLGIIFRKMTSGVFHPLYLPYWFKEEKRDRGGGARWKEGSDLHRGRCHGKTRNITGSAGCGHELSWPA